MIEKEFVIRKLEHFSTCLELAGENIFKIRAYHNAAVALESADNFDELLEEKKLHTIRGVGNDISSQIYELAETGKIDKLERLEKKLPSGLFDMLKIEGLGPKRIRTLHKELNVDSLRKLKEASEDGSILKLNGFGPVMRSNILKGLEFVEKNSRRFISAYAKTKTDEIVSLIKDGHKRCKIAIAGSLRRKKEIVKDADIVIACATSGKIIEILKKYKDIDEFISKGDTKISFRLRSGFRVDIRLVREEEFISALHHFTGSKEHNVQLRHHSKQFDIKINEYGLEKEDELIHPESERELYKILGMEYIPPELREGRGELEAAKNKKIPDLVEAKDLKGIVHVHSLFSDGRNTLEELADFIKRSKYSYMIVSDHSQSSRIANGMKLDKLYFYLSEIDRINEEYGDRLLLKGIECDILPDGNLDYPDHVLKNFDLVIASVHSGFSMDKQSMTKRLVTAMQNKYVNIIGHLSGRLLTKRDAYEFDKEKVFSRALESGVVFEINANPYRLDIDWRYINDLKQKGMRFVISPDAHSLDDIKNIDYGIGIAGKGWLEKKDVLNTMEVAQLLKELKRG